MVSSFRFLIRLCFAGFCSFFPLFAPAGTMYWADAGLHAITKANQDGSAVVQLMATGAAPSSIALDLVRSKIYWGEADGRKIRRADLDGSGMEDLVESVGPSALALDLNAGKMYWTDSFVTGQVHRANLDGSAAQTLVPDVADREGFALDLGAGKMYWTNRGHHTIQRANLDGSAVETLVTGLLDPRNIALDPGAGKMYWAHAQEGKIQRASLDGSGVEDLVVGLTHPHGLALDFADRAMYWTDFGTHKIQRAEFSGSNVQDLVVGAPSGGVVSIPTGIALVTTMAVSIDIKPGSDANVVNPRSSGVIPIAILSSAAFDATKVAPASLTLATAGVKLVGEGRNYRCLTRDVDRDGRADMVCLVDMSQLVIQSGQSTLVLEAKTSDGQSIRGEDSIRIVP